MLTAPRRSRTDPGETPPADADLRGRPGKDRNPPATARLCRTGTGRPAPAVPRAPRHPCPSRTPREPRASPPHTAAPPPVRLPLGELRMIRSLRVPTATTRGAAR